MDVAQPPPAAHGPHGASHGQHGPSDQNPSTSNDDSDHLMCRVCRSEEGNLYYPCLCTGSIKYVHQECLLEWLKYSKKEVCELCNHKYSFQPIYRADMPKALPITEILRGIGGQILTFIRMWLMYTVVVVAWLGIVPLTAARVYNAIFSSSVYTLMNLPMQLISTENVIHDIARGCVLLSMFICTFISLLWLREQIVHGGPMEWLNLDGEERAEEEEEQPFDEGEEEQEEEYDGHDANDVYEEQWIRELVDEGNEEEANEVAQRLAQRRAERVAARAAGRNQEDPLAVVPFGDRPGRRRRENNEQGGQGGGGDHQDENWRDWDRFGDELTWQRLLGLDGSLVFLEHVFWVISLNTFFTVVFAYSPYKIGTALLAVSGMQISFFPSLAAILTGYLAVSVASYVLHCIARVLRFRVVHRWLGIIYLVLKVFILVLLEIGFFPVLCGCWLDVCSLKLLASSYSSRIASFSSAPSASLFLHWMIGMVYVFYSASFVILLREILRPGVLWFMRNLNDPEFNPIQEMIDQPVQRHVRRLGASIVLFFFAILLVIHIPLAVIHDYVPGVLPYNMSLTAETPLSELSVELLILQVVLPALLEQAHARTLAKAAVRKWCEVVGSFLQLDTYLLSDDFEQQQPNPPPENAAGGGLAAEHQALLLIRDSQQPLPYTRPPYFHLRIVALLAMLAVSTVITSIFFFTVPVAIGRLLIYFLSGHKNVHELYTAATGLYVMWVIVRGGSAFSEWFPRGTQQVIDAVTTFAIIGAKVLLVSIPLFIVIPLLLGISFQLVFLSPLRVSIHQSPLFFPWQDWAMGILHTKIVGAAIVMGPDWWMKNVFDQIYVDGFTNIRVSFIYRELIIPVLLFLALQIAFPYFISRVILMLGGFTATEKVIIIRMCYPTAVLIISLVLFVAWQYAKLRSLADHIRNEKYLIGTQLVNYERSEGREVAPLPALMAPENADGEQNE